MTEYRISRKAAEDLIAIANYGDKNFGIQKSNYYRNQLTQRFSVIAAHPARYPLVEHIAGGYRRSVCGVHSIFYRERGEIIEIVRVLYRQKIEKSVLS